jgi:hypothetical protein
MTRRRFISGSLAGLLVCGTLAFASDLKSGPQEGKGCVPFHPLNIFNSESPNQNGKQACLV